MDELNLPGAPLKLRNSNAGNEVFDPVRRRWVALTPEEYVRQHLLHYFTATLGYPSGRIAVEKKVTGSKGLRADIVVFSRNAAPTMIVEVKAASVRVDTGVFEQAARYNAKLGVRFLAASNGRDHYCARIDYASGSYTWMNGFPEASDFD